MAGEYDICTVQLQDIGLISKIHQIVTNFLP